VCHLCGHTRRVHPRAPRAGAAFQHGPDPVADHHCAGEPHTVIDHSAQEVDIDSVDNDLAPIGLDHDDLAHGGLVHNHLALTDLARGLIHVRTGRLDDLVDPRSHDDDNAPVVRDLEAVSRRWA